MNASVEPTASFLIEQAETLASRRSEPLSGVHLLAALGVATGSIRDLLEERDLGFRKVLDRWEQLLDRGPPENLQRILSETRNASRRFGARTPTAPHLLIALLNDGQSPVRRIIDDLGVEATALRAGAFQVAQGLPMRRRLGATPQPGLLGAVQTRPDERLPSRGVAVPVMPLAPVSGPRALLGSALSLGAAPSLGTGPSKSPRQVGQVVPIIPEVGPTPSPRQRVRPGVTGAPTAQTPMNPSPLAQPQAPAAPPRLASPDEEEDVLDLNISRLTRPSRLGARDSEPSVEPESSAPFSCFELSDKKFPILTQVGRNLTLMAARGQLDAVVGRDEEVEMALDVLAKRHGNNPCLIGAAGVGKTSVARGVAARLAEDGLGEESPAIVIEIPISELVAGTGVRGALAGRLNALKKEVRAAGGRVILFFDEIHQLFTGDAAEEIAGDLKLSLARGELPCIGATSAEEYRRVIESDPALSRRFTSVEVEEPTREDAFLVLSQVAERLAVHHDVAFDEDALVQAISWSVRYLPGRALPDKAVSVVDLAGARCRRRHRPTVDAAAVAEVVASQAGMPIERLLESDGDRMLGLEEILRDRVIGHETHLGKIARILRRNAAGLGSRRPIGTFLLLGPTGVGKTETAKAIAEVLFHSESAMTRVDMAEMSEAHAVAKLIGAPPGYVGHDAGGQLTEAVRRRPYQVVLLDEIEKAHPEVLTAFLAVFDEGRMTDSRGRLVDFTNTVIILTSNLGARAAMTSRKRVGFSSSDSEELPDCSEQVIAAARQALAPELYNRIDEVLAFAPLSRMDVCRIGHKLAKGLADELELSRGVFLEVDESAIELLLDRGGFEPSLGARPLRRTMAREIEAPLAEAILAGHLKSGDVWRVSTAGGEFVAVAQQRAAAE